MSTTMTVTTPPPTLLSITKPGTTMSSSSPLPTDTDASVPPAQQCPNCQYTIHLASPTLEQSQSALLAAQTQINDLQAQVAVLNQKASAAVDRWADYEDELTRLRSQLDSSQQQQHQQQRQSTTSSTTNTTISTTSPGRSSFLPNAGNRLSALLSPRKPLPATPPRSTSPNQQQQQQHDDDVRERDDLLVALSREQFLRREAEGRLNETSREVEELSVSLFEQANEMVATERRARAELEKRIEELEMRDRDKRWRLERLEACVGRIERVREVLGETEGMLEVQRRELDGNGGEGKKARESGGMAKVEAT